MNKNPIAAIATPRGAGGVGIIRVSGPDLIGLAKTLLGTNLGLGSHTSWF